MTNLSKIRHLAIDVAIAILVVIFFVLMDLLIISLRTSPAEDKIEIINSQATESALNQPVQTQTINNQDPVFLPILNFHRIAFAPAKANKITKSFFIEPARFEEIIRSLVDDGYQTVFVSEAVNFLASGQMPTAKIIALTFDDGNEDFYTNAWPILQKYQLKSANYIMTGVKGANYLTQEQIKELDKSGLVEIGSHTVWHPYLTKISVEEQKRELKDSKDYLEKLLNKKVGIICYPFGLYNQQIKDLAKEAGYQAGLTFDQDAWQNSQDLLALTRISVYPELNVVKFLTKLKNE